MLLEINIKNFAIIDKIKISFFKGFNVLTGETGAGKSIIIDAVNLILGERAGKDFIRNGKEKSIIEGLFHIENVKLIEDILLEYGIEMEPDNNILLTREIFASGRSISRINGRTVTLNMLKNLTSNMIDIHGQHEHQSLLSWEKHIDFLDAMGKEPLISLKEQVLKEYNKLVDTKKKLKSVVKDDMEIERKKDLLKFQLAEIDSANLKENEEKDILNEYKVLSNSEDIMKSIGIINQGLNNMEYDRPSVIDMLRDMVFTMKKISSYDDKLKDYYDSMSSVLYELEDIGREIRSYSENISYDEERLKELSDRIDIINKLKRKYGKTIKDILEYRDFMYKELKLINNSEEEIEILKRKISYQEELLEKLSKNLTEERKKISVIFENKITNELKELNMSNVTFKVKFDKFDYYTKKGIDRIEFLISTNPGEPLKPLTKIVSGGEMSRIMLAFKSILAEIDHIPCLIFDEIDSGISGRTSQIVGEKISDISKSHQVLCITHLPQIAAMADAHYLIEKVVNKNMTKTVIKSLSYDERIEELSRLLGGVDLTKKTKEHAKEMIEMSNKFKKKGHV
ncbi:DNA repair protein RecN [Clostridiisalibacter paucivorans]|uniref:DNA repair protein RecN n=1 Tax=Clostridiisalibacter paucivorans TaxID=408753 RepID=UPI00047B65BA|nr:DNA repair protein RecN [Clostridiisalibacter paucivorans]